MVPYASFLPSTIMPLFRRWKPHMEDVPPFTLTKGINVGTYLHEEDPNEGSQRYLKRGKSRGTRRRIAPLFTAKIGTRGFVGSFSLGHMDWWNYEGDR